MKRFGDFILVDEKDLKKNNDQDTKQQDRITKAKEILQKAKVPPKTDVNPMPKAPELDNKTKMVSAPNLPKQKVQQLSTPKSNVQSKMLSAPNLPKVNKTSSVQKEKLASPNDFMNDPKNEAPHVKKAKSNDLPEDFQVPQAKPMKPLHGYDKRGRMIGVEGVKEPLYPEDTKVDAREHQLHADMPDSKKTSHVKKFDELVSASTSPGGGGATGKSMDPSQKKMDKDDKPHKKDSPEDKAHDVVEHGQKVPDALDEVKGDKKEMLEHLRSYREMKAQGKGDEWKRSPDNQKMGKSGVSDPMLMSLNQRKEIEKAKEEIDKRCWEGYEPTPGKKPYEKGSCQPAKKNDPAVSGTKIESEASGEIGNRAKAKDESLSPLMHEPKQMIAEPVGDKFAGKMKKSMKDGGGLDWTDQDLMRGLAFSSGSRVGATEGPNLDAQPLVKKEQEPRQNNREVPLHRALDDMDDSKVKT
jgi:hypothetical protein